MSAGSTGEFDISQSACGIPSNALAYSLDVTVVPNAGLGYLTIWPSGEAQPLVSTLKSYDGRVKANLAMVPGGTNGGVSVYASDATNVVLDIEGYSFPPEAAPPRWPSIRCPPAASPTRATRQARWAGLSSPEAAAVPSPCSPAAAISRQLQRPTR
jgi:hypothetical protein